jgi:ClpP class serine protease
VFAKAEMDRCLAEQALSGRPERRQHRRKCGTVALPRQRLPFGRRIPKETKRETMTEEVIVARHDGVMRITMNRPTRKNALAAAMYDRITAALEDADSDEAVRAVILEGSGGSFTAGNDLADFLAVAAGGAESRATPFVRKIAFLDTPLIAAVDGVAIGVGTTILFHCDLVYVTPRAQFRMRYASGMRPLKNTERVLTNAAVERLLEKKGK